jgi:hypothetical protein
MTTTRSSRHWFINPVVRATETNPHKLGTPSSIYRGLLKSRANKKFGEFILPLMNIEYKHYTSVKAHKSTSMLIRWQIVNIHPTQTTQSISDKPSLQMQNGLHTV